jgi:hypothetical protein
MDQTVLLPAQTEAARPEGAGASTRVLVEQKLYIAQVLTCQEIDCMPPVISMLLQVLSHLPCAQSPQQPCGRPPDQPGREKGAG